MKIEIVNYKNKILIEEIKSFLKPMNQLYSNFDDWFLQKVIPDLQHKKRDIFIGLNEEQIIAVGIIKYATENDDDKICTLFVPDIYSNKGYGSAVFATMDQHLKFRSNKSKRIHLSFLESKKHLISFCMKFGFSLFSIKNGVCYMEKY